MAIELIFLAASLQRESFQAQPINPVVWLVLMGVLLLDVAALISSAMWGAMTAKHPTQVTALTLARILLAPWVAVLDAHRDRRQHL